MTINSEKLIFLNIDGSLNSMDNSKALGLVNRYVSDTFLDSDDYGRLFDERCVRWLRYIIKHTGSDIIIMGTWSRQGLESLKRMWKHRELPGEIIDICPPLKSPWEWMEEKNYKNKFVIVNSDFTESTVVIKPFEDMGLRIQDVHRIVTILNKV